MKIDSSQITGFIGDLLRGPGIHDFMITAGRIVLILLIAFIFYRILRAIMNRLQFYFLSKLKDYREIDEEANKRMSTLLALVRSGINLLVWIIALLMIFSEMGLALGPLLASAGVVGLAVGLGSQSVLKDLIGGFFMILENQIRVDDVVRLNGTIGVVESINFRTTVLRDLSGVVHVVPNGAISSLANYSKEWSAAVMSIGVSYKENPDKVMEILKEVGLELKEDEVFGPQIVEPIEIFGLDEFSESSMDFKIRIKTQPLKQWDIGREYRRRIKLRFDQEGIEIPFPQRVLHWQAEDFIGTKKTNLK